MMLFSMIVDDLDVESVSVVPYETDPPPFVDTDAVLACPVCFERLEPIARWYS